MVFCRIPVLDLPRRYGAGSRIVEVPVDKPDFRDRIPGNSALLRPRRSLRRMRT